MPTQLPIAAVSSLLLLTGCLTPAQPPTTQPSSAPTPSTSATFTEEVLAVGMNLGDALEMLTRHRIEFRIHGGAWAPPAQVAAAEMFVIERRDIDDALIIYAESQTGEKMRVRTLRWWRNYQTDMALAKGQRKSEDTHVKSIPMSEIERQFSYVLNPYDSEKVRARERNR